MQTDIYGLGTTLQTLLTGADPLGTAVGAKSSPTRRLPKKLHQLLNQMREPDASQRPKSMDEVKCRLQQIKGGIARSILTTILEWQASLDASVKPSLFLLTMSVAQGKIAILATIRPILPFFWGLLIGSMPYSLIISLIPLTSLFYHYGADILVLLSVILYSFLLLMWPIVFGVQLIAGIRFLFSPGKRLMCLGILAMQVFLFIGIILRWLPSPLPHF